MSKSKNILLFVYGTLKQGDANSVLLRGSEFLGEAITATPMYMISFGCPVVILPTSEHIDVDMEPLPIFGELYKISRETFRKIDMLEGYPEMYDRSLQKIKLLDTGKTVKAYIYIMYMDSKLIYTINYSVSNDVEINNGRYEFKYKKEEWMEYMC